MSKNILIVDPDTRIQQFLASKLNAGNLRVRGCADSETALQILQQPGIDLVVAAVELFPRSGLNLIEDLNRLGKKTPVVLISRLETEPPKLREQARRVGAFATFTRPIPLNRLYEAVEAALHHKILWTERREHPRIPLRLNVTSTFRTSRHGEGVEGHTTDISLGGIKLQRTLCAVCTGYESYGMHAECLLRPHSTAEESLAPFDLELHPPGTDPLRLRGRAVYTFIEEGSRREFVGIRFEDYSDETRRGLEKLLENPPLPARTPNPLPPKSTAPLVPPPAW